MIIHNNSKRLSFILCTLIVLSGPVRAREYHVSVKGNDTKTGTAAAPFRTISRAAESARPGDVITVHEGVYRERIKPPRGGQSDQKRIVYRAAPGEKAIIKGSEVIKSWRKLQDDTWKVSLPNAFFGEFNPYSDVIRGDWFNARGRAHHTGAVYLNGHWLTEARALDDVLKPADEGSLTRTDGQYLLNVAWLRAGAGAENAVRIAANAFAAQSGVQTAACSEGGECIGWIEHGDWVRYERVNFGPRTDLIEIRAASPTAGGIIEIRLDAPNGELLGACSVPEYGRLAIVVFVCRKGQAGQRGQGRSAWCSGGPNPNRIPNYGSHG